MIDAEGNFSGNFFIPVSYAMYATVPGLKKSGATGTVHVCIMEGGTLL